MENSVTHPDALEQQTALGMVFATVGTMYATAMQDGLVAIVTHPTVQGSQIASDVAHALSRQEELFVSTAQGDHSN